MNQIIAFSHFDMDGIGTIINIWNSIKNKDRFRYILNTYPFIRKNIDKLQNDEIASLLITDLNFGEEELINLKKLNKCKQITYIDHHVYSDFDFEEKIKELSIPISRIRINQSYCGTILTYMFLDEISVDESEWNKNRRKLQKLNYLIDLYDRWQTDIPEFLSEALPLNDLFYEYGYEDFFKKFRDGYRLDENDKKTIQKIDIERKIYLDESITKHSILNPYANSIFIMNPKKAFTNDFTIFYPEYDFYLIFSSQDTDTFTYSIRINKSSILTIPDIIAIIKENYKSLFDKIIRFGGHHNSGGITVKKEDNTELLNVLNEILEEKLS